MQKRAVLEPNTDGVGAGTQRGSVLVEQGSNRDRAAAGHEARGKRGRRKKKQRWSQTGTGTAQGVNRKLEGRAGTARGRSSRGTGGAIGAGRRKK